MADAAPPEPPESPEPPDAPGPRETLESSRREDAAPPPPPGPGPLIPPTSRVSASIARAVLRGGNYPWLKVVGARRREKSRRRGGRRFVVRRPDGVTLDAWFSPRDEVSAFSDQFSAVRDEQPDAPTSTGDALSPTPDPETQTPTPRVPVMICHGIFESKERHFERAAWLNARGHDVLLFDHRTHGRSTGKQITFGVHEREDIRAVLDVAVTRGMIPPSPRGGPGAGAPRVVTLGFSLGGGTVLQHAATDDRVAGVIALAPFCDFRTAIDTFRQCFTPWLDEQWLLRGFDTASAEAGFAMEQASALEAIKHIDAPILLAEGGKDPFLPPHIHSQQLRTGRGDKPLTVVRIDDAHHVSLVRKPWPQLDDAIAAFLDSLEAGITENTEAQRHREGA